VAIDRGQAPPEFQAKLAHEERLRRKYAGVAREVSRVLGQSIRAGETDLGPRTARLMRRLLEPVLFDHHSAVSRNFSTRLRDRLAAEADPKRWEEIILETFVLAAVAARSEEQAERIARRTGDDAEESARAARAEQARIQEDEGRDVGQRELAGLAASFLLFRLQGRESGVASFETQAPAEIAKAVELDVLLGITPRIGGGAGATAGGSSGPSTAARGPDRSRVRKQWVSQGDSRVRLAHLDADSNTVPVDEPFRVGGELLMFPGDTSLGATPGNVINCRCSSIVDAEAVETVRRAEPTPEDQANLLERLRDAQAVAASIAARGEARRAAIFAERPPHSPHQRAAWLRRRSQAEALVTQGGEATKLLRFELVAAMSRVIPVRAPAVRPGFGFEPST
jgi:hypothetical protein